MNNLTFLILVGVLSTQLCCVNLIKSLIFHFCNSLFSPQYFCHLIELEKVVAFPEPNIVVFNSYKVRRVNRTTYALGGNITIKEDMDDTFNLFLVANNWQGTTYNKIIDKKFDGFCKMLYSAGFRYKYMKLKKISNLPEHGTCPLAKVCNKIIF